MAEVVSNATAANPPASTALTEDRSVMANGSASGVVVSRPAADPTATAATAPSTTAAVRVRVSVPDVNYTVRASLFAVVYWLERFSPGLLSGYFCKIALVARLVILIARYAQFTPPARHDKTAPSVSCRAV